MALDLVARISLQDDFSRRFNRVTRSMGNLGSAVNQQARQLTGLRTQILGVAAGYASARGAAALFSKTVGEAAKFEMAEITVEAMLNDKALSDDYLKMIDRLALKSPLMDSAAMLGSSKGLVSLTKDLGTLENTWGLIEKLQVLSPEAGVDGSVFALKELASGDIVSMAERFNIPKKALHAIKALPFAQQVDKMHELLTTMNITDEVVEKIANTSMSKWSQLTERTSKFFRDIGKTANSDIGKALSKILDMMTDKRMANLSKMIDAAVGSGIEKLIAWGKKIYELREPILATAKAVGKFVGAVAGIVAVVKTISGIAAVIGFLTSPIGLLAFAIIGIGAAFKAAYQQSEPFRKAVDGIVGAVKALFAALGGDDVKSMQIMEKAGLNPDQMRKVYAFADGIKGAFDLIKKYVGGVFAAVKTGSGSGILAALGFSPAAVAGITAFVSNVKTKVGEFVTYLKGKWTEIQPSIAMLVERFISMKDTVISIFTNLWNFLKPVFSALGNAFMIIADIVTIAWTYIIAPAIDFVISMFQALWKVVGPVLELLGAAFGIAFGVLKIIWDTILKPFVKFLLSGFKEAFERLKPVVDDITTAFGWFGDKLSWISDWLGTVRNAIANFKVPDWLSRLGGGGTVKFESSETVSAPGATRGPGRSHYHGIDYIPTNSYQASLHKGEAVLTAAENKERMQGGSGGLISISGNTFHVRQESDIKAIAYELAKFIESEGGQMA